MSSDFIVEIDPDGDLLVTVTEDNWGVPQDQAQLTMRVSRQILIDNSDYFKIMLAGSFREANMTEVKLEEDTLASVELWFRGLHGALNEACYTMSVAQVWEVMQVSQKYFLPVQKLETWFEKWYERINIRAYDMEELTALLLPCQAFNHAQGFAKISTRLARHSKGIIKEVNPSQCKGLNIEKRIIDSINQARTSIRRSIEAGLLNILPVSCPGCKEKARCQSIYIDELSQTGVWPIGDTKKSNNDILESNKMLNWNCEIPEGACRWCKQMLEGKSVVTVRESMKKYWHGLCLDCMDRSGIKTGKVDWDFWHYASTKEWGQLCRLKHSRNSWYFSYMGRLEEMTAWERKNSAARQAKRSAQLTAEAEEADEE